MNGLGRLGFIRGLAAGSIASFGGCGGPAVRCPVVSSAGNRFTFISPLVREPVRFFLVGDTHMTVNDDRGNNFLKYTRRMGGVRRESKETAESFRRTLREAKAAGADLLALVGDQISFPTLAGVEFMRRELDAVGVPWTYTSGNHDWHYEGMPGMEKELRAKYEREILLSMYPEGANPLCHTMEVKGVRFVAIDDSIQEVLPEQLEYWRHEVATGKPLVLLMHIPLYIPGCTVAEAAVGHPEWGAKTDPYYLIERRPQWPEAGHTEVTMRFREEVFAAPNLIGVFTGHEHRLQVGISETGAVQVVCPDNRTDAARLEITLLSAPLPNPPVEVLPPPDYSA